MKININKIQKYLEMVTEEIKTDASISYNKEDAFDHGLETMAKRVLEMIKNEDEVYSQAEIDSWNGMGK